MIVNAFIRKKTCDGRTENGKRCGKSVICVMFDGSVIMDCCVSILTPGLDWFSLGLTEDDLDPKIVSQSGTQSAD